MTQLGLADSFQRPRQRVVACTHTCISVKLNALVNIYYFVFFSLLSFLFPFFYYFFFQPSIISNRRGFIRCNNFDLEVLRINFIDGIN